MEKKFERKTEQKHPTNPNPKTEKPKEFDVDEKTIKKQQKKE